VGDPVASGLVPRLNRPSGNVTGFAVFEASLGGKWLELLKEIAPGLQRATIMFDPETTTASVYVPSFETAARSLKIELITTPVHSDVEIETAITALGREPGGGLVVMPDIFMFAHRAPIILAAARNNVPSRRPLPANLGHDQRNAEEKERGEAAQGGRVDGQAHSSDSTNRHVTGIGPRLANSGHAVCAHVADCNQVTDPGPGFTLLGLGARPLRISAYGEARKHNT
jgi:hypothetical protein